VLSTESNLNDMNNLVVQRDIQLLSLQCWEDGINVFHGYN